MKLYTVRYEGEIVVLADDVREATKFGGDHELLRDLITSDDFGIDRVEQMIYLPGSWDLQAIPYGAHDDSDPDRTVGQWIGLGAAPAYVEARQRLSPTGEIPFAKARKVPAEELATQTEIPQKVRPAAEKILRKGLHELSDAMSRIARSQFTPVQERTYLEKWVQGIANLLAEADEQGSST